LLQGALLAVLVRFVVDVGGRANYADRDIIAEKGYLIKVMGNMTVILG
jgi:hypothetical protein